MKLLKQPWFLIAVFLLGVYTYQISKTNNISLGTNVAHAVDSEKKKDSDELQKVQKVDVTTEFKTSKVKTLQVATYQNLDIKLEPNDGDKILLQLVGQGRRYKNEGSNLKDWLDINNKRGKLIINSYSKDGINVKFNDLFKVNKDENLKLVISFPKAFTFKSINVESVSSDVKASGVNFKEISLESVSGDADFVDGKGDKINISTVSGDIDAKNINVNSGAFKSVSGDATIKALVNTPDFSFESVSGDLKLSLPSSANIDVNFQSMTGKLENEFGSAQEDSGKLSISSLSGDAEVTKIK